MMIDFRTPQNEKELKIFLQLNDDTFFKNNENEKTISFHQVKIPKKGNSKEYRVVYKICEANYALNRFYKSLAVKIRQFCNRNDDDIISEHCHGYVGSRGTYTNALPHCGKKNIAHADIKDFFSSISKEMVEDALRRVGIHPECARAISNICTFNGRLPPGIPTSCIISNIVCMPLDIELNKLAASYNCSYTRYSDDITISGNADVPNKDKIKAILSKHGFNLSEEKFRCSKRGQNHFVTGLCVSDIVPRVPRRIKKWISKNLHRYLHYGMKEGERDDLRQLNKIYGMIRYVLQIENSIGKIFLENWNKVLLSEGLIGKPNKSKSGIFSCQFNYSLNDWTSTSHCIYVDESVFIDKEDSNRKRYLTLCISHFPGIKYQVKMQSVLRDIYRECINSPAISGRRRSKVPHFTDDSIDIRTQLVSKALSTNHFESTIAYCTINDDKSYKDKYLVLISRLLKNVLLKLFKNPTCEAVDVYIENNPFVSKNNIESALQNIAHNNKNVPVKINILSKKDDINLCVSDYMMGVHNSAKFKKTKREKDMALFNALLNRIINIYDLDSGETYSRRNINLYL